MTLSPARRLLRTLSAVVVTAFVSVGLIAIPTAAVAAADSVSVLQVRDATGNLLEGAEVRVTPVGTPGYYFDGTTGADGSIDLNDLGAPSHMNPFYIWVEYDGVGEYWDGAADSADSEALAIEADGPVRTATLDIYPPTPEASISGTVRDALTDQPIEGISVSPTTVGGGNVYGGANTGTDGTYTARVFGNFPSTVKVGFFDYSTAPSASAPYGYTAQFWDGSSTWEGATPVDIANGAALTGIDALLMPFGAVSGTVNEYQDGKLVPVAYAGVEILNAAGEAVNAAETDESGAYTVSVAPGTYKVAFGEYSSGFSATQYYDRVTTLGAAKPVTVTGAQNTTNINAVYGTAPTPGDKKITAGSVSIEGVPAVDQTLTANPGSWTPSGVDFAYQWYRDGKAITGATAATYTPVAADIGFTLTVRVDGTRKDYQPATATSAKSAAVIDPNPGSIVVTVSDDADEPVGNAAVSAVLQNGSNQVFSGATDATGVATLTDLPRGTYTVQVYPPQGAGVVREGVTVNAGAETALSLEVSRTGLPADVTITPSAPSWQGGVSIGANSPFTFSVTDAADAESATWELVRVADGEVQNGGALTESPAGTYSAEIPGISGSGHYTLTATLTFGGVPQKIVADLYIDPSGTVVDQYGTPVAGATVTISRSDTMDGTYTVIPDGSTLLSPRNRTNPDTTGADGSFGWDTVPGFYKVAAELGGVTVTTLGMEVPPERLDLVLALATGAAPAPELAPAITGTAAVGQTLTASSGLWPSPAGEVAPIEAVGYQWMRNGTAIDGATSANYVLTAADSGARIAVTLTLGRSHGVDAGSQPLTFTYTTTPVAVKGALATTGAGDMTGAALLGMLLVGLGVMAVSIRHRRESTI